MIQMNILKQNRKRLTDLENKLMVTRRVRGRDRSDFLIVIIFVTVICDQ